jgi:hypothetical protein
MPDTAAAMLDLVVRSAQPVATDVISLTPRLVLDL